MADKLSVESNAPHLLVEAIPGLTDHLVNVAPPIVIVSALTLRKDRLTLSRTRRYEEEDEERVLPAMWRAPLQRIFFTDLFFEVLQLGTAILTQEEIFRNVLKGIREHLKLDRDQPVRIACVGSHGSLLVRDRANVGRLYGDEAKDYLRRAWLGRTYVRDLRDALNTFHPVEFCWLADVYPSLRDWTKSPSARCPLKYQGLVRQARDDLIDRSILAQIKGCIPLIYARSGDGWHLWRHGDKTPSRTTSRLLQQFAQSKTRSAEEHVLVKLLPEDVADRNPCDNPIVLGSQLEEARQAGISAILLDGRYGVIHRDEVESGVPPVYAAF